LVRGFRQRFTAAAGAALAAIGLAAAGLVAGAPAAGAAVVLDVTATPSTGLQDGDQVVLTGSTGSRSPSGSRA
jgi:hypothetical protein